MKKTMLLLCAVCLFLLGCPADPDEANIPNGQDFKDFIVKPSGSSVITDIYFYGRLNLREFFYYYDRDNHDPGPNGGLRAGARFLIKCRSKEFKIYKESEPGVFTDLRYSGAPAVKGNRYHLEFPLSALELDSQHEFNIYYWFFAESSGDRMPDSGRELLALKL